MTNYRRIESVNYKLGKDNQITFYSDEQPKGEMKGNIFFT
jgi:hypothetical protein